MNLKKICLGSNYIVCFCVMLNLSCKKYVTVAPPSTSVTGASVYLTDATAIAAVTYLYSQLSSNSINGTSICSISYISGLSADELTLWGGGNQMQMAYYKNALTANVAGASYGSELWVSIYPSIFICNSALEGLENSKGLTPAVKKQLQGESYFMRGFYYFYLVNLFGDVPLVLGTNYSINRLLPRSSKDLVYQQIISDLVQAEALLSPNYLDGTLLKNSTEKIRLTQSAAAALLAKVYLYIGDYTKSEEQTNLVINGTTNLYKMALLNSVFSRGSSEVIWQLQSVSNGQYSNTTEAPFFNLSFSPTGLSNSHPVYLSSTLINGFEANDQRKVNGNWIGSYTDATGTYNYSNKYRVTSTGTVTPTEYRTIFRLAEQYLIRAEDRVQLGNIQGAKSDLDSIRIRAGLSATTLNDKTSLLNAILHERQVELFTEMGNRWFDLKRTSTIDSVMSVQTTLKGGIWKPYQKLYPIQPSDLTSNVNLIQNPGYN